MFAYCRNNPVNHSDPDGDWVVDAVFLAADISNFAKQPSLKNAGWVALSAVCFLDASGMSSTLIHSVKTLKTMSKLVCSVDKGRKLINASQKSNKIKMNLQLFASKSLKRNGDQQALAELAKESIKRAKSGKKISYEDAQILDSWAKEYKVDQHHQAYRDSGKHWSGGDYSDHTHIYNAHVPYQYK
jgi:hypothetical protein